MICGIPQLNFEDLESVARYEGDYNQQHPTVLALWSTLHAFSLDEKKAFLKFTTGLDRSVSHSETPCCLLAHHHDHHKTYLQGNHFPF